MGIRVSAYTWTVSGRRVASDRLDSTDKKFRQKKTGPRPVFGERCFLFFLRRQDFVLANCPLTGKGLQVVEPLKQIGAHRSYHITITAVAH